MNDHAEQFFMNKNGKRKTWDNVISLGFFCGVAQEMERHNLRSFSSPFDWLITEDFNSVLSLIDNSFRGFFDIESLAQEFEINPAYYYDTKNHIHLYHDFSAYKSLGEQYDFARKKYDKKIKAFYDAISAPTLFIRYCVDSSELKYIDLNYANISRILQKHNRENRILLIGHEKYDFINPDIDYFYVEKDKDDYVARMPFQKNDQLKELINTMIIPCEVRLNNEKFQKKKRVQYIHKIINKIKRNIQHIILKPYKHNRIY